MGRRIRLWQGAVAVAVALGASAAADDGPVGFELGVRSGYALPAGGVDDTPVNSLQQTIAGAVPVWLDAGYRASSHFVLGAYFAYGAGSLGSSLSSSCASNYVGCVVHDVRVGAEVHYHLFPENRLDPWVGAGFGFEWLGIDVSSPFNVPGPAASGWELFNVQAGLDVGILEWLWGRLQAGPFVALSIAQFDSYSDAFGGGSFAHKALHEWFVFGVRFTGDLVLWHPPLNPATDTYSSEPIPARRPW